MSDFDVDPPMLSNRTKLILGGALLTTLLIAYFALWGSVSIENKSGRTIDRFSISVDDKVAFKESALKPGESASVTFNFFTDSTVQISAELNERGSSISSVSPGLFPSMNLAIDEEGGIDFKGQGRESSQAVIGWPRLD